MSIQTLIESMETLLNLHQQLLAMTVKKTEVLQKNDIETLSNMLREEQKVLTAIQVAEQKREKASLLITNHPGEATVSEILKELNDTDQEKLSELQIALIQVLGELQEANALNQQLLQYSLQFVNMNLDLLAPEQELPNYTKEQGPANPYSDHKRSMFDSQA